jgi:hypothetical protein
MFAVRGLEVVSQMLLAAGGRYAKNGSALAAVAAELKANVKDQMWNGTNFCDGVCSEVKGASLLMTNM